MKIHNQPWLWFQLLTHSPNAMETDSCGKHQYGYIVAPAKLNVSSLGQNTHPIQSHVCRGKDRNRNTQDVIKKGGVSVLRGSWVDCLSTGLCQGC